MYRTRSGDSGFSVVELLVAVAIILIIVAIAVPRMLQGRVKAREAAAISSMKAIQSAQMVYSQSYPEKGYASSLASLGSSSSGICDFTTACLIDTGLSSGVKGGYVFDVKGDGNTPDSSYTLTATPDSHTTLDSSHCVFTSDETGIIKEHAVGSQPAGGSGLSMAVTPSGCGN